MTAMITQEVGGSPLASPKFNNVHQKQGKRYEDDTRFWLSIHCKYYKQKTI